MTLLELLIAGGLTFLLTGLTGLALHVAFRNSTKTSTRAGLLSEGLLCLRWLERDVSRTEASSILWDTSSPTRTTLGLIGRAGVSARGTPLYDEFLTLYLFDSASSTLLRKQFPPEPGPESLIFDPEKPPLFEQAHVDEALAARNGSERLLSGRVRRWSGVIEDGRLLSFELSLTQPWGRDRSEDLELSRKVAFRF